MSAIEDLIVLGGGPAGAVAAWLAARDGLRVALIDPCSGAERIEGMSPRLQTWLSRQGLLAGFDGLIGPLARVSHWGTAARSDNGEWVVSRTSLDAHLRAQAVAAGATLRATSGRIAERSGGLVHVALADGTALAARTVFDARGRKAHAGRAPLRRGPATLSICGWVATDVQAGPPAIAIMPIRQGWIWVARTAPDRAWVQVVGDAEAATRPAERLKEALRDAAPLALTNAYLCPDSLVVRDSAPVLLPMDEDLAVLPIGDAAAAGDPLSGHGQFWAVSSALAATAVRRSRAARPGPETDALARRFLAGRLQQVFLRQARVGRDFIRMIPTFEDAPFWVRRHGFPDEVPLHSATADFETERAVVVRDGLLEEAETLITPASPTGVAWFGKIPAVEAWQAVRDGQPVSQMVARWGEAARYLPQIIASERQVKGADDSVRP